MHTIESAEDGTAVPLLHCDAPSVQGVSAEKLLLCCMAWNGSGFSLLTNVEGWMLLGLCCRKAGTQDGSLGKALGWARSVCGDPDLLGFLAVECSNERCGVKVVVVPMDSECCAHPSASGLEASEGAYRSCHR